LFVCLSLLLSACSPDKSSKAGNKVSSKANEFARNTEVEKVKMTESEKEEKREKEEKVELAYDLCSEKGTVTVDAGKSIDEAIGKMKCTTKNGKTTCKEGDKTKCELEKVELCNDLGKDCKDFEFGETKVLCSKPSDKSKGACLPMRLRGEKKKEKEGADRVKAEEDAGLQEKAKKKKEKESTDRVKAEEDARLQEEAKKKKEKEKEKEEKQLNGEREERKEIAKEINNLCGADNECLNDDRTTGFLTEVADMTKSIEKEEILNRAKPIIKKIKKQADKREVKKVMDGLRLALEYMLDRMPEETEWFFFIPDGADAVVEAAREVVTLSRVKALKDEWVETGAFSDEGLVKLAREMLGVTESGEEEEREAKTGKTERLKKMLAEAKRLMKLIKNEAVERARQNEGGANWDERAMKVAEVLVEVSVEEMFKKERVKWVLKKKQEQEKDEQEPEPETESDKEKEEKKKEKEKRNSKEIAKKINNLCGADHRCKKGTSIMRLLKKVEDMTTTPIEEKEILDKANSIVIKHEINKLCDPYYTAECENDDEMKKLLGDITNPVKKEEILNRATPIIEEIKKLADKKEVERVTERLRVAVAEAVNKMPEMIEWFSSYTTPMLPDGIEAVVNRVKAMLESVAQVVTPSRVRALRDEWLKHGQPSTEASLEKKAKEKLVVKESVRLSEAEEKDRKVAEALMKLIKKSTQTRVLRALKQAGWAVNEMAVTALVDVNVEEMFKKERVKWVLKKKREQEKNEPEPEPDNGTEDGNGDHEPEPDNGTGNGNGDHEQEKEIETEINNLCGADNECKNDDRINGLLKEVKDITKLINKEEIYRVLAMPESVAQVVTLSQVMALEDAAEKQSSRSFYSLAREEMLKKMPEELVKLIKELALTRALRAMVDVSMTEQQAARTMVRVMLEEMLRKEGVSGDIPSPQMVYSYPSNPNYNFTLEELNNIWKTIGVTQSAGMYFDENKNGKELTEEEIIKLWSDELKRRETVINDRQSIFAGLGITRKKNGTYYDKNGEVLTFKQVSELWEKTK
jgi:penicillin-binding protein 2A